MSQAENQVTKQIIPEGYKKTEIGIIPSEWGISQLGELVVITSGESPSRFDFISDGVPYFKVEQLNNGHVYAEETEYRIKTKKTIPAGSIIFPKRGASILLNKIRVLKKDSFMDTNLMTLTCLPNVLDNMYLYNILIYQGLDKVADTTSIPQINNKHIIPFIIPIPVKAEQTAIANALSDVDVLLSELEKLIAKKQAMKTATMQQLLTGQTRLPQFAYYSDINSAEGAVDGKRKGTKPSELGEIPEDWEVKQVKEVCGFIVPGRNKPRSFSGNIPWVTTSDIDSFKSIDMSKVSLYVSREEAIFIGSKVVPKNAVIMSCVGELGIVAVVEDEIVINQQLHAFIPSNAVCSRYLAYTLTSLKEHFYSKATKTTLPYLNKDNCNSTPIALPTKNEQIAIATILSDMDNEIQTLEQRLSKTRQIKQGMMQELLTGKNRLLFENLMSKERYLNGNSVK